MLQYVDALFAGLAALGSPDLSLTDPDVRDAIVAIAIDAPPPASFDRSRGGLGACSAWASSVGRPAGACEAMTAGALPGTAAQFYCVSASFGQDALRDDSCAAAAAETTDPALRRWYLAASLVCDFADAGW